MDEITTSRLTIEIGASSENAKREIGRVTDALSRLRGNTNQKIRVDSKDVDKAHKKVGALSKILNSLKRIAFYRMIRSAIKAVGEAMNEGAQNAYWYSKTVGDQTKYISQAYDSLASSGFKMQNQLGAAWATLKAAITPVLLEIVRLVTLAAQAVTQFFAVLGGKGTYLKAIDYSKDWAEQTASGAKAAKEWKNQLLGFDEINRLEEPSSGGGGGGSALPDYENMFEEAKISDWAENVKDMISAGNWKGVGSALAEKLNSAFASVDFYSIGKSFAEKLTIIPDLLINFFLTFDSVAFTNSIIAFLIGAFVGLYEWLGTYDWGQVGQQIYQKLKEEFDGINWSGLATSFFSLLGRAFGSAAALIGGFLQGAWVDIKDYFDRKTEEAGGNVVLGFLKGIFDGLVDILQWIHDNVLIPFIDAFREAFGIHSPSKVMEEIGDFIVEGFWNGIEEKWNEFIRWIEGLWDGLKTWWEGLSLGAFHIPQPVLSWGTRPAGGWVADVLGFFGLPSVLPTLNVSWMARGGIVDGATLIGAGEAGKEAIIPLERNTEWISKVAAEMSAQQSNQNGDGNVEAIRQGVFEAVMAAFSTQGDREQPPVNVRVFLDSREIKAGQDRLARAWG